MAKEKKPIVYQIFQHLLDNSDPMNDQVVRITAGRKFHAVADEWEFQADNFLPYAPVMLDRLMALVQEVELPETKMALLNTISLIVYRLEHHVSQRATLNLQKESDTSQTQREVQPVKATFLATFPCEDFRDHR